ncbi:hypothetical protein KQX64_12940 [Rhodopseudomonas palustris]|nr:hypothetical protein KQX64_12940 [Rhodopseudomonas palustris]
MDSVFQSYLPGAALLLAVLVALLLPLEATHWDIDRYGNFAQLISATASLLAVCIAYFTFSAPGNFLLQRSTDDANFQLAKADVLKKKDFDWFAKLPGPKDQDFDVDLFDIYILGLESLRTVEPTPERRANFRWLINAFEHQCTKDLKGKYLYTVYAAKNGRATLGPNGSIFDTKDDSATGGFSPSTAGKHPVDSAPRPWDFAEADFGECLRNVKLGY